jgi:ribonuclease P protein component
MVSSRRIGGAVIRNRARRLMREAFRLNQQKLKPNTQLVLVARSAISGATLAEVETELLQLMRAADVLTTES